MAFKTMVGSLSVALLLTHGLPPVAEPDPKSDECQLPRPVPIHWIRPVTVNAKGIKYTSGILR